MKLRETYVPRRLLKALVIEHDIITTQASEASFEAFCDWRELYMKHFSKGCELPKFDVRSQVDMFDYDLQSLYEKHDSKVNACYNCKWHNCEMDMEPCYECLSSGGIINWKAKIEMEKEVEG